MKCYVIKSESNEDLKPEFWQCGKRWTTHRSLAARFTDQASAREHISEMGWHGQRQAMGSITIAEVDSDLREFDVKIVRTEVTEHVVRVQAKDETEAKQIVYEKDCRDEFASVWEETDASVETEYYPEEAFDGEDN